MASRHERRHLGWHRPPIGALKGIGRKVRLRLRNQSSSSATQMSHRLKRTSSDMRARMARILGLSSVVRLVLLVERQQEHPDGRLDWLRLIMRLADCNVVYCIASHPTGYCKRKWNPTSHRAPVMQSRSDQYGSDLQKKIKPWPVSPRMTTREFGPYGRACPMMSA